MPTTFSRFCHDVRESGVSDREAHSRHLETARQLLAAAREKAPVEVTRLLAAACPLLELLADGESLADPQTVHGTLDALLEHAEACLSEALKRPAAQDAEPDAETPASVDPEAEAKRPRSLHEEMVLGRILVELGHLSHAQIAEALEYQKSSPFPIGECLLVLGLASPDVLLEALRLQEHLRRLDHFGSLEEAREELRASHPEKPTSDPAHFDVGKDLFLGEVMLGAGMITGADLERAMREKHFSGKKLGETLIEYGVIDAETLAKGLELQATLRAVAGLA